MDILGLFGIRLGSSWDMFEALTHIHHARMVFAKDAIIKKFGSVLGLNILDLGCGIGMVSESMSRLGANVVGIDCDSLHIELAKKRANSFGLNINYECTLVEDFRSKGEFDVVLAMDVLEHVDNLQDFLDVAVDNLMVGGIFIASTLNKTLSSFLLGKVAAEYVLGIVPQGIHDWQKFISPGDLCVALDKMGLQVLATRGIRYSILEREWCLSDKLSVNYIMCATRLY